MSFANATSLDGKSGVHEPKKKERSSNIRYEPAAEDGFWEGQVREGTERGNTRVCFRLQILTALPI
jgi:hypothetical protein